MIPSRSLLRAVLGLAAVAWPAGGVPVSAAPRYLVRHVDGTEKAGEELRGWSKPEGEPKLDGEPLFRAEQPVRWIRSGGAPSERTRGAWVELVGGDCLPGIVIGYGSANGSAFQSHPPHVEVVPSVPVHGPSQDAASPVRVVLRWIRRIVWDGAGAGRGAVPPPGTVRLRDGRTWRFRSVRWGADGATVLHEGGITRCAWHDLVEIHLPESDPWDDHLDLLATLTPDMQARLVQCEADDGLRTTASTLRFLPRALSDSTKTSAWFHLVQPAWSLDVLWLRFDAIRTWRWFAPHEVPLTAFPAVPVRREAPGALLRPVRFDRSVAGTPLRVGETVAGWGLGTHAPQSLECAVPLLATEFRVRVGLDQAAGPAGGCATGAVVFGKPDAAPAYRTPILRGSSRVADSGWLKVPNLPADARRLFLAAEADPKPRPAGADPLDIRDFVDWLEPEWRLDRAKLAEAVGQRVLVGLPALAGWTPAASDRAGLRLVPVWDAAPNSGTVECATVLRWSGPFATFERELAIGPDDRYLAVTAARRSLDPTKSGAPQPLAVQVRIEGRAWAELGIRPADRSRAPEPQYVSVVPFRGKTVRVELVPMGEEQPASKEPAAGLEWVGLGLIDRQPGLLTVFEDDPKFARELGDGPGRADVVHEDSYSGAASLVVDGPARGHPRLPGLQAAIRERPSADEFRFVRFVWRKAGGGKIGLRLAHDGVFGRDQPGGRRDAPDELRGTVPRIAQDRGLQYGFAYDAGPGDALHGPSLRLDGQTPVRWSVVTRDLYSDFGQFRLTGLQFTGDDEGGQVWIDQVHLARRVEDFAPLVPGSNASRAGLFGPDPADPNLRQRAYESGEFGPIVSRLGPRFALDATSWDGVVLVGTLSGRENVVRTMPIDATRPSVFRAPLEIRAGKKTVLVLGAGHDGSAPWKLVVRAAGETLHEGLVSAETFKEKWKDLEIDLSRFAGRRVVVEVQQHAHGGNLRPAYWSRLDVIESPGP